MVLSRKLWKAVLVSYSYEADAFTVSIICFVKNYQALNLPIVMYGSESWQLTKKDCDRLSAFASRALRTLYGPININSQWRIRYNDETCYLFNYGTIVQKIPVQRLRWLGHLYSRDKGVSSMIIICLEILPGRHIYK